MSYLTKKPGSLEEVISQKTKLEAGYQDMFKKELEKAGKGIGAMTPAEKSAFFKKIDKMHNAKNEEMTKDSAYAIGMAQAKKSKGDEPPLDKSTITKGHEIAKSILKKEDYTKKDVDKFHTKLDKLVHKSFGHSSDEKKKEMKEARWEIEGRVNYKGVGPEDGFHMVIDAPTESAAEDKAFDELVKARKQRKIGPGGGGGIDEMEIEYIEKTNDRLQPVTQQRLGNSYDPKLKEDFFVNDKKDTLKKFSGRIGYNKSTLTDYLAKKTGKNKDDVYFDDTELVYKDKTVLRNAETKTVDQMLKALQKEEVHPHVKKMVKDGESDAKIKKMHPELKDDELEKLKETHMSTAKAQNQKQKEVGGEKEPIKTSKNEWKTFAMMAAELRENNKADKGKKEQEAGEDTRDSKQKTMTGQTATSPEMNPRVDYKY